MVIGVSSSTVEVIASPLIGPMGLGVHWVLRVWISSTTWIVATVWWVGRLLILSSSSLRDATTSGLAAIWFIKVACVWDMLETWVSVIVSLVWRLEISIFMFSNRLLMSCKIAVCSFNCLEKVLFCSYWVCM